MREREKGGRRDGKEVNSERSTQRVLRGNWAENRETRQANEAEEECLEERSARGSRAPRDREERKLRNAQPPLDQHRDKNHTWPRLDGKSAQSIDASA